jgi:ATP-dependent DNA helicase RecG
MVNDPEFVRMFETIAKEELARFGTDHFLAIDAIHRTGKAAKVEKDSVEELLELGIIERVKRGKFVLAKRLYAALGRKGAYTRRKGLDRETNRQLILKHLEGNALTGANMDELMQVLPSLTRNQIYPMLCRLRDEGKAVLRGKTRGGRWYPVGLVDDAAKSSNPTQSSAQSNQPNHGEE